MIPGNFPTALTAPQVPNSAVSRATWDPRNLCRDERNATMAPGDGGQRVDFKLWAAERVMLGSKTRHKNHQPETRKNCSVSKVVFDFSLLWQNLYELEICEATCGCTD